MRQLQKYLMPVLWVVVIASITQYIFIAAVPRLIFTVARHRSGKPLNTVIAAPKTDAKLRRVVLPNPDFVYSACFYDLKDGDLAVSGQFPDSLAYCSVALYGSNVLPYYIINNVDSKANQFRFRLTGEDGNGNQTVHAKTRQGVIIMRWLAGDSTQREIAKKAQGSFAVVKVR
jgi:uncharacterized membrane protein